MDVIVLPAAPSVVLPDTVSADVTVALLVEVLPDTVSALVTVALFVDVLPDTVILPV